MEVMCDSLGMGFLVMRWRWQMIWGLVVFMLGQWLQTEEVKFITYHISGYEAKSMLSIPYRTGRYGRNIPYRPAIRYG